ncbi:unnamed protein product [Penicillium discolor]
MRFATVATALVLVTSSIAAPAVTLKERSHTFPNGYCSENSSATGMWYCSTDKQQIMCTSNTTKGPGLAYCT